MSATALTAPIRMDTTGIHARPGLARLTAVELRKMVDTRAGFWLQVATVALTVFVVIVRSIVGEAADHAFASILFVAVKPAAVLLPVAGILLVTSEWSQRTGIITFALVPQRSRVLVSRHRFGVCRLRRGRRPAEGHRRRTQRDTRLRRRERSRNHRLSMAPSCRLRRSRPERPLAAPPPLRRQHPMVAAVLHDRRLGRRRDHRHRDRGRPPLPVATPAGTAETPALPPRRSATSTNPLRPEGLRSNQVPEIRELIAGA